MIILITVALLAGLSVWRRRAGHDVIPAHVWALMLGILLVSQQALAGDLYATVVLSGLVITVTALLGWKRIHVTLAGGVGLLLALGLLWLGLEINVWLGRIAAIVAALAWWRWGRKFIWFPLGFWGVLVAGVAIEWLAQNWVWSSIQAAVIFSIAVVIFLWHEKRRPG